MRRGTSNRLCNIRKMEYALIGDNLVGKLLEMMQKFRRDDSISTVSLIP